jgi:elongation factor G
MSESSNDRPILRLVVSPLNGADNTCLQAALVEIAGQNTSVSVIARPQEGHYSLEATTESALDTICERLRDEYHLLIDVGPPAAILLETVRKQAEAEGKYIRQTGGSGNYGHCKLRIEPAEPGKGYQFIDDISAGAVPSEYIDPIDQGIRTAMKQGVLAGFPVVDVRVTLYDGSYHETDSNPMAFTFASSIAFKEAAKKASPVILEPMMSLEIEVPQEIVPAIRREISVHRGRIDHELTGSGLNEIRATVPLSELLSVAPGGLAEFPMKFSGYEPVRDSGLPDDGKAGVTANKPNYPRKGSRSEVTPWTPEEE